MVAVVAQTVLILVLLLVTTTVVVVCYPSINLTQEQHEINYKIETGLRKKHKCGVPQPRLLYLHEIVGDEIWEKEYKHKMSSVMPYGVVLHRCENSGCCDKYNKRCLPANETEVVLSFGVEPKSSSSSSSHLEYKAHVAKNHTTCTCQKIGDNQIK